MTAGLCHLPVLLQVVLLSSKMGSQGAQDIPPGGSLVRLLLHQDAPQPG
jgi:hypothetical protein